MWRRNADKDIRQLERELAQNNDEAIRNQLIAAYERISNWEGVYRLLPKQNPCIEAPLLCGCPWGNRDDEIPTELVAEMDIPGGAGVLSRCFKHGLLHAIQADVEALVEAYDAGVTRLYTFNYKKSTRGYYILDMQYSCSGVTIGPDHASHVEILPNGWLQLRLWFPPEMIHSNEAFVTPINEYGRGQVEARIDPEELEWRMPITHYVKWPSKKYRRNADQSLRGLERHYQSDSTFTAWQRLNVARMRAGLPPVLDDRMFTKWLKEQCLPNFEVSDLGPTGWKPRAQFPLYQVKINILGDLPILPSHRGHYYEALDALREIGHAALPYGFYGLIDSNQELRYSTACLDCRNSAEEIDREVDEHGDGFIVVSCNSGCGEFEISIPRIKKYPCLYVISKEILGISNNPDPDPLDGRMLPGGAQLIMDQWMVNEDPRAFFEVDRQRGSYPTKIVMGTKKGTAWVEGRLTEVNDLRSTHYAHYRYDVGPDESPISFGQGNYDLYPPEVAIEDYTRRLLKLYRSNEFELILDEIV
jgi:hypothetical protein